jgi:solute carrier family 25 carnitine/acylcarnitine transporter 20/29
MLILQYEVEMFKVRMQGQYGAASDQRLRTIVSVLWSQWGLRKGIMRGYWVKFHLRCPYSSTEGAT